jgi:signal transduction histidine kinase/ActR/RegA family two-component response regulator
MKSWETVSQQWRELSIAAKFSAAFGLLLILITIGATISYGTMTTVRRQTEAVISTSSEIQYLVLKMNGDLERARRLERDFFLRYPRIGFSEARQAYAEPAQEQIAQVVAHSAELQQLIAASDVSDALHESDVNLNLYLSAASRYADTFEEAVELVGELTAEKTGLQAQLAQKSISLLDMLQAAGDSTLLVLYRDMQAFERDYLVTRQRPFMQSAFNTAVPLRQEIERSSILKADEKTQALAYLDDYLAVAEEMLSLDVAIRSKSNEFDLQAEALDPISTELIALAGQEVVRAHTRVARTDLLATGVLAVTTFVGLVLAGVIANVLNRSIARNVVKLTKAAGELQAGDLEARAQISSHDELGQLADSFNAMAARIRGLVNNLEQKVAERTVALRETNEQLEKTLAELRDTQEQVIRQERLAAIGQLTGGIAHDFNNLLTSIILSVQILQSKPHLPSDLIPGLDAILEESRRAAKLVQQILDFSRRAMMDTRPVDLVSFIEKTFDILKRTLPEHINLVLERQARGCVVEADPTRIQQVLLNLATNARDAMPEGGELHISLSQVNVREGAEPPVEEMGSGEWICMAVSDTGSGIPPDVLPHIFEPFFTTKPVGQGTGLGLAQVYGIVRQHEGYIGVETEVGKGTTFRIYLPVHREEGLEKVIEEAMLPPQGQGETILLVEDEERLRKVGQEILKSLGYRVLAAANGREALKIYQVAGNVALVITDVVMPEMGGKRLLQELEEITPHVKALAITGYVVHKDLEALKEIGFLDVVQKPFDVETLAQVIRQALDAD